MKYLNYLIALGYLPLILCSNVVIESAKKNILEDSNEIKKIDTRNKELNQQLATEKNPETIKIKTELIKSNEQRRQDLSAQVNQAKDILEKNKSTEQVVVKTTATQRPPQAPQTSMPMPIMPTFAPTSNYPTPVSTSTPPSMFMPTPTPTQTPAYVPTPLPTAQPTPTYTPTPLPIAPAPMPAPTYMPTPLPTAQPTSTVSPTAPTPLLPHSFQTAPTPQTQIYAPTAPTQPSYAYGPQSMPLNQPKQQQQTAPSSVLASIMPNTKQTLPPINR